MANKSEGLKEAPINIKERLMAIMKEKKRNDF